MNNTPLHTFEFKKKILIFKDCYKEKNQHYFDNKIQQ